MKSSILKTHENCEGSISLTLRTRSSWRLSKNARKKLETSVAPAMPCNSCSKSSGGQGMGKVGENFGVELDKSHKQVTGAKVHVVSLMDICHLKNAESEAKH